MNKIAQLIFCLLFSITAIAQNGTEYLDMANKAYDAGEKDKAKSMYERAAALNSPDAHYALAYKYVVSKSDAIFHYSEAAKMGHSDATAQLFEELFFRSESLTTTNPELAYEIYTEAKKANPNLTFFWDDEEVKILRKCIEAGPFDAKEFISKYEITNKDTAEDYSIWELAADASHNGRFGSANPKLVLQLVCRGGSVPAEKIYAVQDAYENWKGSTVHPFDPCNYVSSGFGLAYCSEKAAAEAELGYQAQIKRMATHLKNNAGPLLKQAYTDASNYIQDKAFKEEGFDGSGYIAWAIESADSQKKSYINLVKKINKGFHPTLNITRDYDKELNIVYKTITEGLKKKHIKGGFFELTDKDVKDVQALWVKYRDSSAKLFAKINPELTEQEWQNYLSKIRIAQLKAINSLRELHS